MSANTGDLPLLTSRDLYTALPHTTLPQTKNRLAPRAAAGAPAAASGIVGDFLPNGNGSVEVYR